MSKLLSLLSVSVCEVESEHVMSPASSVTTNTATGMRRDHIMSEMSDMNLRATLDFSFTADYRTP